MKEYIDVFMVPVQKKKLAEYRKTSMGFGKLMLEYGATRYGEFVGDDLKPRNMMPDMTKSLKIKPREVLVTAVVAFDSKAARNKVNKETMLDRRAKALMEKSMKNPVIDMKRVLYGGFSNIVNPVATVTKTFKKVVDAPIEQVIHAWTDQTKVQEWWGPNGFTNPVTEVDARKGGRIYIEMQDPMGTRYPISGTFYEVLPEKLVFNASALDNDYRPFLVTLDTITFGEQGSQTKVTAKVEVLWASPKAAFALQGMPEGWKQQLERLAEFMKTGHVSEGSKMRAEAA